jgi:hypothetical protein
MNASFPPINVQYWLDIVLVPYSCYVPIFVADVSWSDNTWCRGLYCMINHVFQLCSILLINHTVHFVNLKYLIVILQVIILQSPGKFFKISFFFTSYKKEKKVFMKNLPGASNTNNFFLVFFFFFSWVLKGNVPRNNIAWYNQIFQKINFVGTSLSKSRIKTLNLKYLIVSCNIKKLFQKFDGNLQYSQETGYE